MCDIADEFSNSLSNVYPELIKNNEKVNFNYNVVHTKLNYLDNLK